MQFFYWSTDPTALPFRELMKGIFSTPPQWPHDVIVLWQWSNLIDKMLWFKEIDRHVN